MSVLTERSQARTQAGENVAHFKLTIAGETWLNSRSARPEENRVSGVEADFTDASGASELSFEAIGDLRPYVGERVVLWLGYGDRLIPYFSGELTRPSEGSVFFTRKARALGPFAMMERREYMEQKDFRNRYIGSALYETAGHMGRKAFPSGTVEVIDPRSYTIDPQAQEAIFVEEVNLQEGAETLMGFAEFVAADLPGSEYGRLRFQPRPRPGAGEKAIARYGPDDYREKGFRITNRDDGPYSEVIVFRRNPDGFTPVYARAPIENRGLKYQPEDRPYRITDFAGDQTQARQTAYETARSLGAGEFGFELDPISINPDLYRYGQIEAWKLDERRDGTYRETYQCLIEGLAANVAAWEMPVSGGALLLEETKVARAVIDLGELSAGAVGKFVPKVPVSVTWDDPRTFEDLASYTFEELS